MGPGIFRRLIIRGFQEDRITHDTPDELTHARTPGFARTQGLKPSFLISQEKGFINLLNDLGKGGHQLGVELLPGPLPEFASRLEV